MLWVEGTNLLDEHCHLDAVFWVWYGHIRGVEDQLERNVMTIQAFPRVQEGLKISIGNRMLVEFKDDNRNMGFVARKKSGHFETCVQ